MPKRTAAPNVDLESGVVLISKAASALAALIKRARERQQPIIVTQKGYPTGVILDVELYTTLCARAAEAAAKGSTAQAEPAERISAVIEPPPAGEIARAGAQGRRKPRK
jgi:prevent-host-death family protein